VGTTAASQWMRVRVDSRNLLFGGTIWTLIPNPPIPRGSKKPFFVKSISKRAEDTGGVGTHIHTFHQGSRIILGHAR